MDYILAPKGEGPCVFCGIDTAGSAELEARYVVCRGADAFVILNRYPFAAGHLLVIPYGHHGELEALSAEAYDGLFRLARAASERLRAALRPQGMNLGMNLGTVAGAGVAEHLHVHLVPRWGGDTNFMPVLADTRVIPQALEETLRVLRPHFADLDVGPRARS